MYNFDGRYAVVTGAAKGIGAAVVKKLLEEGISGVAMWDMNEELLQKTAKELDETGTRTITVACNVGDYEQVKAAAAKTLEVFGTVDILVNNAGITRDAMFHKMTEEQWNQVINVNQNSLFYVTKEFVPVMREKAYGKIINISSTSAMGNVGQANYAATKAAVKGFTYTLAKELGPKGINVNAISPGYIDTDMTAVVPEQVKAEWMKGVPMRRFGAPIELANVVAFLASDESGWVTGECITVSGGGK